MSRRRERTHAHSAPEGDLALATGLRLTEVAVGEHRIRLTLSDGVTISLEGDLTVAGRRMKLREAAYSVLETLGRTLTHAKVARGDLLLTFETTHTLIAHCAPKLVSYSLIAPGAPDVTG